MKDVDHVVGCTFLRHDNLLATIDDKVASLIVATVLTVLHPLLLIQVSQLAEVASEHHWDFADVDTCVILLKNDSFDFTLALACFRAVLKVVLEFLLAELDVGVELSRVREVPHACLVRKDRHHAVVRLHDAWATVHMHLTELNLVHYILVRVPLFLASRVLWDFLDLNFTVLSDNFLDVELEKAIEASNLLGDEAVLLEVGLDHGPGVD